MPDDFAVGLNETIEVSDADSVDLQSSFAVALAEVVASADDGIDRTPSESLSVVEALGVSQGAALTIVDSYTVAETLQTGAFQVEALGSDVIRVTFPVELHFDGIMDATGYSLSPAVASPGVPVNIVAIAPRFTVLQEGASGAVIPETLSPGVYDVVDGVSTYFRLTGSLDPLENLGDFITITTGQNVGRYQIVSIADSTLPESVVVLDRPLSLLDDNNAVYSVQGAPVPSDLDDGSTSGGAAIDVQLVAVSGNDYTFRVKHPSLTADNPLFQIYRIRRIGREGTTAPVLNGSGPSEGAFVAEALFSLSSVVMVDYRTFRVTDPAAPKVRGTSLPAIVDRFAVVIQLQPSVGWKHTTGVQGVDVGSTKLTNEGNYDVEISNVFFKRPKTVTSFSATMKALGVPLPKLLELSLDAEGVLTVTYSEPMQPDSGNLNNPEDYSISGPSTVTVQRVHAVSDRRVALITQGLGEGDYTLTISTSSPKDIAGNPIDPAFNAAVFTASTPLRNRSVFTDKGPITKPPLSLQTGTGATFDTFETLTLPGASLTSSHTGKRIRLTGSALNDDVYKVLSIVAANKAKVLGRFNLPDASSGSVDWELYDPRSGVIADDPADVLVNINGADVTPEAVVGLLGQVVLADPIDPAALILIDYSWCCNPRVEVRRLNSHEFRLNAWNRDVGGQNRTQHHYRFNNVLVTPADYDPGDMLATLEQPLQRGLKYRAYERAYTATLNDPSALLFNTPIHRIAYPPASRPLLETSVFYEATVLPEADATPWTRHGVGSAVVAAGVLVIVDNSMGPFPSGEPLYWTQPVDLTFDHVVSVAWRFQVDAVTATEGVWTGIAAGYSDDEVAYVVGFLDDGGTKKIGILKRGVDEDFASAGSWIGGITSGGSPTNAPVAFDWSVLHSYRLFTDRDGIARVFVDGDVVEILRISKEDAPFLEEVNSAFEQIQSVFFGSLSRPTRSTSSWDFVRYLIQPINAQQVSPSSFVAYEANDVPELDPSPWTPIGFHGTATILDGDSLLLDSTSATDPLTSEAAGLVGADFKGYVKIEPLLTASSQVAIDVDLQLLTQTHGVDPDGLMVAVDDGFRLMQLSFFPDAALPKLSYGGRSLPEEFSPFVWSNLGSQPAQMVGRTLQISDASLVDGRVYFIEDVEPVGSDSRVFASSFDYILETRCKVESHTVDGSGFAGAFAQIYDGTRAVGFLLQVIAGVRYVALHADGVTLGSSARFAFEWNDGKFHTYRLRKSTGGNLVSVFVDGEFFGSFAYSGFTAPPPDPVGVLSFGSSTPTSSGALSVVEWAYCNAWRVDASPKRYIGLWKGVDSESLTGYHLPLKASGRGATVAGNALGDPLASFIAANVLVGDRVVVDAGPNKGVYEISAVINANNLAFTTSWPAEPSTVDYRIVKETDWSVQHKYRLLRDSTGSVTVLFDTDTTPVIAVGYNSIDLPPSGTGIVRRLSNGLAAVAFGSFNAENLEQSVWDYVRYGITRTTTDAGLVPPHQVLNQWNVMESPERLFTVIPHNLTSFKSGSTGITPQTDSPAFLTRSDVAAFTQLNQDTPLVPQTQTFQNRGPFVAQVFASSFNNPEDVLNSDPDFTMNDGALRFSFVVPEDVLYTSLEVVTSESGERGLITPFGDQCGPELGTISYQNEVCLNYTADTLPENDGGASTPWVRNSEDPGQASASTFAGVLTYGTGGLGTKTAYLNNTPLPDAPSLRTEASFRLKLLQDTTLGTGDSQVRFGLSAPGMTLGLGFVTFPSGERFVQVLDVNNGQVLGSATIDYLDGDYHTYRIVRDPSAGLVEVLIDS